jgi:hypothetical protein
VVAIQITIDNTVFGGLGGAGVHTGCISWGKEEAEGRNVMVFTDLTIALPLLCQAYGPDHVRPARAAIAAGLRGVLAESTAAGRRREASVRHSRPCDSGAVREAKSGSPVIPKCPILIGRPSRT